MRWVVTKRKREWKIIEGGVVAQGLLVLLAQGWHSCSGEDCFYLSRRVAHATGLGMV